MTTLSAAISQVIQRMLAAKRQSLCHPGKVLAVYGDGNYSASVNGEPAVSSVSAGDFPLNAGDPVWVAPVWGSPKTAGSLTPGRSSLGGDGGRPVILGKKSD